MLDGFDDGRCWHGGGYDDVGDSGVALSGGSFLARACPLCA